MQGSKIGVCCSPIIMSACRIREPCSQFVIILSGRCTSTSPVLEPTAFTKSDSCQSADVRRERDGRYGFGGADLRFNTKIVEKKETRTSHVVFFPDWCNHDETRKLLSQPEHPISRAYRIRVRDRGMVPIYLSTQASTRYFNLCSRETRPHLFLG